MSGGWKNNFGSEVEWLNGKPSKEFSETKHLIYSGLVNFQPTSTTLTLQAKDFIISTKPWKLYTLLLRNYKVSNPSSNPYNLKCYPHTLIKKKRNKIYVKMITGWSNFTSSAYYNLFTQKDWKNKAQKILRVRKNVLDKFSLRIVGSLWFVLFFLF